MEATSKVTTRKVSTEMQLLFHAALFLLVMFTVLAVQLRQAHADDGAQIGDVIYSGTGCADETVAVILSPDRRTVSLLFDDFVAEITGSRRGGRPAPVKKECILKIPLLVPSGVQARLTAVDLRGYISLPQKALGHLRDRVNFEVGGRPAGRVIGGVEHRLIGPRDESYVISQLPDARADQSWTPCGRSVDVRVVTYAAVVASPNMNESDVAIITVDSADIAAEDTRLKIGIEYRACNRRL